MSKQKTRFPSIKAIACAVADANREAKGYRADFLRDDPEWTMDVRLQVYPDGDWALHTGDSSYDQDHRGYWGASSLDGRRIDSRGVAKDLLDQCREMHACGESDSGSVDFEQSA